MKSSEEAPAQGLLILVATPIGNLADLSGRAAEALATAEVVCCEDTRRTGRLLEHCGAGSARLLRLDDHTETAMAARVCAMLESGAKVALVTDAGMPGLCDPGAHLVATAAEAGHQVTVIPGPSAGVAALALSGMPATRHAFEGFLPRKGAARSKRLAEIAAERRTVVLFEAPHRLGACLADLARVCGAQRRAVVAREITKLHEQVVRGTLDELAGWAADGVRGEVVIVIEGAAEVAAEPSDEQLRSALRVALESGLSGRDAVLEVSSVYEVSRRRTYDLLHSQN